MTKRPKPRTRPEDPKRLRQCLEALSEACGHDVYRVEVIHEKRGSRLIITCSNATREESVARLIAGHLHELNCEAVDLNSAVKEGG